MADGMCVDGTVNGGEESSQKVSADVGSISQKGTRNADGLKGIKPSFYIRGDSGELCSNFRVNGLGVRAASAMLSGTQFSALCTNGEDNCRKKRCSDRYDSSESSDSGVATLSCSESSALSSSGTSDITEPRSPFSTTSNHSSECSDDSSGVPSPGKLSYSTPPTWDPSRPTQWQSVDGSPHSSKKRTHPWSSNVPLCEENDSDARTSPWKLTNRCSGKSMAPNVPLSQEGGDRWPWSGKESERDEGPPLPPPPLVAPSTPLTPVTANIVANVPPKSLEHQTAIVNQKTAIVKDVTAVPSSKRTPDEVTIVPSSKRLRVEHKQGKQLLARNKNAVPIVVRKFPEQCVSCSRRNIPDAHKKKCGSISINSATANNITTNATAMSCVKTILTGAAHAGDRTQDKNTSVGRKNMTVSEFRCPSVQPLGKNCTRESKMRGNEASHYYPSASMPHTAGDKAEIIAAHQPGEVRPWDRFDMNPRTAKMFQKVVEKNCSVSTLPHARKVFSKLLPPPKNSADLNRNGINVLPSQTRSSEKLDALLASPTSAKVTVLLSPLPKHNNSVAKLNKTESLSMSVVSSKISSSLPKPLVPIIDVGKNGSQDISDASSKAKSYSEKESLVASSSPLISECSNADGARKSETAACSQQDVAESSCTTLLPSPILSVPRTIRFPATDRTRGSGSSHALQQDQLDGSACKWSECTACFDSSSGLLEHLQLKHVNAQVPSENYVCLWGGCKVYGKVSCSNTWLERHVLSHGGNKVLRCIFDGCSQRFSSQNTLQRHVNSHFSEQDGASGSLAARRNVDNTNNKLFRRNGKKLRYRRQPWSARMFDYFDCGIMERLQFRLMEMTERRTLGNIAEAPGNTMSFRSRIMARRIEKDGAKLVLLRWFPTNILDDEWVTEEEVRTVQDVPISSLPASSVDDVHAALFGLDDGNAAARAATAVPVRRRGRKPVKLST